MKLEGLAVVFDRPTTLFEHDGIQYKEIIDSRALDATDVSDVVLRYNHEGSFVVLARTRNNSLKLEKRPDGLYMEATLNSEIQAHRDVYAAVKSGLVNKMSFAFAVADGGDTYSGNLRTIRNIKKLMDVAIVDQPAYQETWVEARAKFEEKNKPGELELQAMELQANILKRMCKQ